MFASSLEQTGTSGHARESSRFDFGPNARAAGSGVTLGELAETDKDVARELGIHSAASLVEADDKTADPNATAPDGDANYEPPGGPTKTYFKIITFKIASEFSI